MNHFFYVNGIPDWSGQMTIEDALYWYSFFETEPCKLELKRNEAEIADAHDTWVADKVAKPRGSIFGAAVDAVSRIMGGIYEA
jgi:hypothetical protein